MRLLSGAVVERSLKLVEEFLTGWLRPSNVAAKTNAPRVKCEHIRGGSMSEKNSGILYAAGAGLAVAGAWALLRRRNRYELGDKVVLITGGSRGLGLVLAREFAARGARVAVCARDAEELESARENLARRGAQALTVKCDVRDQAEVKALIRRIEDSLGSVDVLVNCAGVIQVGPLETQTQEDFENLMAVHFWGPFYTMQEVLPNMRERREGRIVNIASIGGKIAVPHLSSYCASKFALSGLSKAFAAEVAKDNIAVTTVYPGLMRTGSHINARFKGQNEKEFALFSLSDATPLTTISAERAARKIIDACMNGDAELVITVQAKLTAKVNELAPEFTSAILALTNRLLPGPGGIGTSSLPGAESTSAVSPSPITALIDTASVENNELSHAQREAKA
jgi:NAD(P)-dependent dehydrogenase (short-subunit alcohol dehydrogenase family)